MSNIKSLADAKKAIQERGYLYTKRGLDVAISQIEQAEAEILRQIDKEIKILEDIISVTSVAIKKRRNKAELRVWKEARKIITGETK